jgi:hypothetical protein
LARWGWLCLTLALGAAFAARAWPFSVDDAFIVARYAQRLGAGQGYTFQAGAPSDGVTGPLWLFLLSLGVKLGCDPVWTGKLLGLASAAAAAGVVARQSWQRYGGSLRAPFLAGLLASAAPLWIWAVGGLETGLATLCLTLLLCGAVTRPRPRLGWVGAGAAALPWLRPELVPLAFAAVLLCAQRVPERALRLALAFASGPISVLLFRALVFDHFLPLSAFAKPASLTHGIEYVLICLRSLAALSLLPLLFMALPGARNAERALLLAIALHAAVVACAGGDWMAGARLFVPIVPIACFVAALGWERLARRHPVLSLLVALIVITARFFTTFGETSAARASGQLRERRLPELLNALRDVAEPIAILDIGAVGYRTGRTLIDLGGLTEAQIAYAPGGHIAKRIDSAWLSARAPQTLVLHSRVPPHIDEQGRVRWFAGYAVERHVLAMPWVLRDYRVHEVIAYDHDYFYLVLTRSRSTAP